MYLLNASEVSTILTSNQSAGTVCGTPPIDRFMGVLLLCTNRVEEMCEIDTLARTRVTDTFQNASYKSAYGLRLSGAFLPDDPDLEIVGPSGEAYDSSKIVNHALGVIQMPLQAGTYTVSYDQGFEVDDDGVFKDVPEYLKSIAKYVVLTHYRLTTLAGNSPENVSFEALIQATRREMYTRLSKRFDKPRYGVLFPLEGGMGG